MIIRVSKDIISIMLLFLISMSAGCSHRDNEAIDAFSPQHKDMTKVLYGPVESAEVKSKILSDVSEELVPYKGIIEHIFFHPLIVYPEMAFDNDYLSKGYNDWFVTVKEFNKILDSLYKKGFILVDIKDTYAVKQVDGRKFIARKELLLPKGKKPLIISIDDVNYYEYMIENGNIHKLILDSDGNVATSSITPKGEVVIAYDNEIIPILDRFIEEHKDFSLNGAKGIIALTGYEGVLGYRTNKIDSPDFEKEKSEAIRLVNRLKETGWSFASHGYGHLDSYKISYERLVRDTDRWKKEVEPIVGITPLYIYPFGSTVPYKDPKFKYLLNSGFDIFCGVGLSECTEVLPDCILFERRPIDGYSFHNNSKKLLDLFDSAEITDQCRPGEY